MKKIKENAAFIIATTVAIGVFISMMLIVYRGDISIYIILPISVFIGWFAGFVAYVVVSLSFPGTDEGWEYPFPKISLFNHY